MIAEVHGGDDRGPETGEVIAERVRSVAHANADFCALRFRPVREYLVALPAGVEWVAEERVATLS